MLQHLDSLITMLFMKRPRLSPTSVRIFKGFGHTLRLRRIRERPVQVMQVQTFQVVSCLGSKNKQKGKTLFLFWNRAWHWFYPNVMHPFRWYLNVLFVIKYTTKVLLNAVGAEQMRRQEFSVCLFRTQFSSTWNVIATSFCPKGHTGRSSAGQDSEEPRTGHSRV